MTDNAIFTESTVSANVKLIGQNGADIMLTVRTGATVEEVTAVLAVMASSLKVAKDKYHLVPQPPKQHGGNGTASAPPQNGNAPMCPTHGRPMKSSQHGGWFCPEKVAETGGGQDGSRPIYCKAKSK